MKRISFGCKNKSDNILHIETELGIINVYVNLHDLEGRLVESVEIYPDNGVKINDGGEKEMDYLRVRLIKYKERHE